MKSIAEISAEVSCFCESHGAEVARWVKEMVNQDLLAQNQDTLLVRVGERFDFTAAEKASAAYRLYAGQQGQEATYSLGQLVRMLTVKYLHGWSLRDCAQAVATNLLLRWFCGFGLSEATPDHSTLSRFEQWTIQHLPRDLFDLSLQQIDQDFPEEREATQIGDTFALYSHTADLSLYQLLGRLGLRLWQSYLALLSPDSLPNPQAQALYDSGLDPQQEKVEFRLSPEARDAQALLRAQRLCPLPGVLALAVKQLDKTDPQMLADFHLWRERMQKVLADECWLSSDAAGQPTVARLSTAKERGSYRILTPVDPDITLRVHDDDVARGYNVSLAVTTNFVREIAVATGATPDSVGVDKLIAEQKEHLGLVPPKLVYDRAAGTPKKIADVAKASDNLTHLVVHLVDHSRNRVPSGRRYGPLDFVLDDKGVLTCPNGETSSRAYRSGSADGWNYRFMAAQCKECPLMQKCRGDAVKPDAYRQVFISDYQSQQRAAIAYTKTAEFELDMKLRPHVERILACVVRYNDARITRRIGLANADFQVKMAGMAYNLKHWLVLTLQREKAQRVQVASP